MHALTKIRDRAQDVLQRFDLHGKSAVVIGGNKGLGQAMALALASAGADVCVAARGPEGLEDTASAIASFGRHGNSFALDATSEQEVKKMLRQVLEWYGTIDILVNSQGTVHLEDAEQFSTEQWNAVITVNLQSVFFTCKHIGKRMLEQGKGKIINISSVRAFQGRARDLAYAPSKGAVNQLTKSLAIEWGHKGINVNGIAPVFTKTAINKDILRDETLLEWVLGRIPMKRLGEFEDLFGPVIFLASEASNFVNGHILPVDGGWLSA
ncbi:2-deoxy-D-gluconate 3-dehydrogenase [candidate division KSB3 bacterium]|uniref:2-deoxy-D-gluconate 3-dehydrogenase n=1 Tax=candidate division KSB3 bacterium TaxID=2044937 RepID=A0A2G6E4S9_9BACT|nr:MAG: 2-deoxy-D-gluconate 3-dehydrogenase [candidate division KSB3 bacterium]PIE29617.1 MAG: 2-deoxy-D-gluconate 3-dehydrogenase [candidate division KSB3 bacterium]